MTKQILKLTEINQGGGWSCYYDKNVIGFGNAWYAPARALGLSPADYIKMVYEVFKPDSIFFSEVPADLLVIFYWKDRDKMRKFKNWINKEFRDRKFYVN